MTPADLLEHLLLMMAAYEAERAQQPQQPEEIEDTCPVCRSSPDQLEPNYGYARCRTCGAHISY